VTTPKQSDGAATPVHPAPSPAATRAIGSAALVLASTALGITSVYTTLALRQWMVEANGPWDPPSAYTPLAVIVHVSIVALALGTLAFLVRRRWVTAATHGAAIIATVAVAWTAVFLYVLGNDMSREGPAGRNVALADQFFADGGLPAALIFLAEYGTIVVVVAFHLVHMRNTSRPAGSSRLRLFSIACIGSLAALGAIFPAGFSLNAQAATRDHAVFQDMIDYAKSAPERVLPGPAVGTRSKVNLEAKAWVETDPANIPGSLLVCSSERLSFPATHSPWTHVGDLEGGTVRSHGSNEGDACFLVRTR
jgi:hypothetical protein